MLVVCPKIVARSLQSVYSILPGNERPIKLEMYRSTYKLNRKGKVPVNQDQKECVEKREKYKTVKEEKHKVF